MRIRQRITRIPRGTQNQDTFCLDRQPNPFAEAGTTATQQNGEFIHGDEPNGLALRPFGCVCVLGVEDVQLTSQRSQVCIALYGLERQLDALRLVLRIVQSQVTEKDGSELGVGEQPAMKNRTGAIKPRRAIENPFGVDELRGSVYRTLRVQKTPGSVL